MTSPIRPEQRLSDVDLDAYLDDPTQKQRFVTPMFDRIAPRYDAFTRLFSLGMDAGWKRDAVTAALAGHAPRIVLDLAAGTGDLATAIVRIHPTARAWALDASLAMTRGCAARLRQRDRDVSTRVLPTGGDMMHLPFRAASVDLITAGYGIRNVPDPRTAIAEMRRVLQPDGRVVLLDFYRPPTALWRALFLGYLQRAGNAVGWWWHRDPVVYGYIAESIRRFMSWREMQALLEMHGFRDVRVTRYLGGAVARHEARAA